MKERKDRRVCSYTALCVPARPTSLLWVRGAGTKRREREGRSHWVQPGPWALYRACDRGRIWALTGEAESSCPQPQLKGL